MQRFAYDAAITHVSSLMPRRRPTGVSGRYESQRLATAEWHVLYDNRYLHLYSFQMEDILPAPSSSPVYSTTALKTGSFPGWWRLIAATLTSRRRTGSAWYKKGIFLARYHKSAFCTSATSGNLIHRDIFQTMIVSSFLSRVNGSKLINENIEWDLYHGQPIAQSTFLCQNKLIWGRNA